MKYALCRLFAVFLILLALSGNSSAQPESSSKAIKPYKILTSGKQVTVKSTRAIQHIMVWTASGHRIVEQRGINATTYSFNVGSAKEKAFFLMIQYETGKPYTEKIGVR